MLRIRKQNLKTKYGKRRRRIIYIIIAIVMVCSLYSLIHIMTNKYTPPSIDKNAKSGTPTVDESFLYGEVKNYYDYSFSMAANLYQQEDQSLKIYLTNPENSAVYLQCVVSEKDSGKTLYKSGLIEPGKYLESMKPVRQIENEMMSVEVNVYAYELETFYSKGTTTADLVLQPW